MEQMDEVYVISLAYTKLYLKDIGDNLSISFADKAIDGMYFTEDLAKETVRFLNSNTRHFLTAEPLNDQEDGTDNLQ